MAPALVPRASNYDTPNHLEVLHQLACAEGGEPGTCKMFTAMMVIFFAFWLVVTFALVVGIVHLRKRWEKRSLMN